MVGVNVATWNRWLKRGRERGDAPYGEFAAEIDRARAQAEQVLVRAVVQSSKTSWRAAAWLLEHGFEGYGRRPVVGKVSDEPAADGLRALDELAERRRGVA
jgi:hypothetical protein